METNCLDVVDNLEYTDKSTNLQIGGHYILSIIKHRWLIYGKWFKVEYVRERRTMKSIIKIFFISLFIICITSIIVQASSYYSYSDLNVDYALDNGIFGSGKNGYKQILVKNIKGNSVFYTYTKFLYDDDCGHEVYKSVGKTYKAKLTRRTEYYMRGSWEYIGLQLHVFQYGYGTDAFKNLKILQEVSKSTLISRKGNPWYVKIRNGKITTMVEAVVLAI